MTLDFEYLKNGTKVFTGENDRINIDAPLLAAFSRVQDAERVLDFGSGNGILPFWLFDRGFKGRATTVELRSEAVGLLARSAVENNVAIEIIKSDLREFRTREKYDVVLSNPPYFPGKKGAVSGDENRAVARSDVMASLSDIAAAAKRNLKEKGRFVFCYPARRLQTAFSALAEHDFSAKRMRFCRHDKNAEPWLALIDARYRGGEELQICRDFIATKDGAPTGEMREIAAFRENE